jgi:hypothetical protein
MASHTCISGAVVAAALLLSGCDEPAARQARQPIEFAHDRHIGYFASGQHREEKIAMHLRILDLAQPPEELAQGRCAECHQDLAQRTACASCHLLFQDEALRENKGLRRCVACHRGAWSGSAATLPTAAICVACHAEGLGALAARPYGPRVRLARAGPDAAADGGGEAEPRWVQVGSVPANVYFSHTAHVRFAAVSCGRCHEDVSGLSAPPTSVRSMSMSECLRCHAERGASTDCLTCHK